MSRPRSRRGPSATDFDGNRVSATNSRYRGTIFSLLLDQCEIVGRISCTVVLLFPVQSHYLDSSTESWIVNYQFASAAARETLFSRISWVVSQKEGGSTIVTDLVFGSFKIEVRIKIIN